MPSDGVWIAIIGLMTLIIKQWFDSWKFEMSLKALAANTKANGVATQRAHDETKEVALTINGELSKWKDELIHRTAMEVRLAYQRGRDDSEGAAKVVAAAVVAAKEVLAAAEAAAKSKNSDQVSKTDQDAQS